MKKLNKIIGLILAALFMFCFAPACSCKKNNGKEGGYLSADNPAELDGYRGERQFKGTHIFNVGNTDIDLIADGATDYTIVIPSSAPPYVERAVDELNYFFGQSAGITFGVVKDTGLSYDLSAKYISIGETGLLSAAGITMDVDKFGYSGYVIKTAGNTVFLSGAGHTGYGSLYAVYEFLKRTVNYETYWIDEIHYDTGVRNLKLPDFDVIDIPDFQWRVASSLYDAYTTEADRFRQQLRYGGFEGGGFWASGPYTNSHTLQSIFPRTSTYYSGYGTRQGYFASHPKWYASIIGKADSAQLCFTARGDGAELEAFIDETVKHIDEDILAKSPHAMIYNLGGVDDRDWCGCDACNAEKQKYGVNSAVYIKWVNRIAEKVEKLIEQKYPSRNRFKLSIFAYYATYDPPVVKNAEGKYAPIDQSVALRDNVAVYYPPIDANFQHSLSTNQVGGNQRFYELGFKWKALSPHMLNWFYNVNYRYPFVPYNSFDSVQELYRDALEWGSVLMYDQGLPAARATKTTGFNILKQYSAAKLQWDVNQSYSALIDDWFANYFKGAAAGMRKYFDEMRVWMNVFQDDENVLAGAQTSNYANIAKAQFFPKPILEKWLGYIGEAYAAIAPLEKTDVQLYRKLNDRICLESLSPRYLMLEIYTKSVNQQFDNKTVAEMQAAFDADCVRLKVAA